MTLEHHWLDTVFSSGQGDYRSIAKSILDHPKLAEAVEAGAKYALSVSGQEVDTGPASAVVARNAFLVAFGGTAVGNG